MGIWVLGLIQNEVEEVEERDKEAPIPIQVVISHPRPMTVTSIRHETASSPLETVASLSSQPCCNGADPWSQPASGRPAECNAIHI